MERDRPKATLKRAIDAQDLVTIKRFLTAHHPWLREQAVHALGYMCAQPTETDLAHVIELLADPSATVRKEAARTLGLWRHGAAGQALLPCLRDGDADVRGLATRALERIGDPQLIPMLQQQLADALDDERFLLLTVLASLHVHEVLEPLAAYLTHDNPHVRRDAVTGLGHIGSAEAVRWLRPLLFQPNMQEQLYVADILGDIGGEAAHMALLDWLRYERQQKPAIAGTALAKASHRNPAPLLVALTDSDPNVRYWIVVALGILGDQRAIAQLEELAQQDTGVTFTGASIAHGAKRALQAIHKQHPHAI
jgi:HEAT repeat protein